MAGSTQSESSGALSGGPGGSPAAQPSAQAGTPIGSTPGVDLSGADVQGMRWQQIMPKLQGLDPGGFTRTGAALHKLGSVLDDITGAVAQSGNRIASNGSWKGQAASKAMGKFQDLHDQAAVLAMQSHQAGNSLEWFGSDAIPPYKNLPAPQVMSKTEADAIMGSVAGVAMPGTGTIAGAALGQMGIGPDGQNTADKAARSYVTSFNQEMGKMVTSLPKDKDPSFKGSQGFGGSAGSQQTASGVQASGAGIGGANSSANPFASAGPASQMRSPSAANPYAGASGHQPKVPTFTPNASLQGYAPPAAPQAPTFTPASPVGGGSAFGGGAMMPGGFGGGGAAEDGFGPGGRGGLGKNSPVEDDPAETGAGADGAAGEGAAQEAAGARAAGEGEGEGGMPMGGSGGGGSQDKERQRQAWMHEDSSIWGTPTEDIGSILE